MWTTLIKHMWKKGWRSSKLGTSIITKLIMGFMVLYFGLIALAFGFFFDKMAEELFPNKSLLEALAQFTLYYLLFDIYIRVVFQETSDISLQQYILHPIKRSKIVHFILGSSLMSGFWVLPMFFIIPFCIGVAPPIVGVLGSILLFFAFLGLLTFSNYAALLIKQIVASKQYFLIVTIAVFGLIGYLDYIEFLPTHMVLEWLYMSVSSYYITCLIPFVLAIVVYRVLYTRLLNTAYLSSDKIDATTRYSGSFEVLDQYGIAGDIIGLNLRMMWRNKRLRIQAVMGIVFIFYGFIAFNSETTPFAMMIFWGLYFSGLFALQYGQYLWCYQGEYFEFLQTIPLKMDQYIRLNYYYLVLMSTLFALPALLFYFLNPDTPWIILSCYLFNMGINLPIMLFAAAYNKKKVPINEKSQFNMKGVNGTQFLVVFGILLIPLLLAAPFMIFFSNFAALKFLAILGFIGCLMHPIIMKGLARHTRDAKHSLVEGFRNS